MKGEPPRGEFWGTRLFCFGYGEHPSAKKGTQSRGTLRSKGFVESSKQALFIIEKLKASSHVVPVPGALNKMISLGCALKFS
ncbi:unnamed protein product [Ilex paraguariensis]|uniref:Uncharacterized protein n=1 Tax=Ilex paraguariensis TaxID=185542 RepID=A0ABC8R6H2_9AQUA